MVYSVFRNILSIFNSNFVKILTLQRTLGKLISGSCHPNFLGYLGLTILSNIQLPTANCPGFGYNFLIRWLQSNLLHHMVKIFYDASIQIEASFNYKFLLQIAKQVSFLNKKGGGGIFFVICIL